MNLRRLYCRHFLDCLRALVIDACAEHEGLASLKHHAHHAGGWR
jgi:hypothetical protein